MGGGEQLQRGESKAASINLFLMLCSHVWTPAPPTTALIHNRPIDAFYSEALTTKVITQLPKVFFTTGCTRRQIYTVNLMRPKQHTKDNGGCVEESSSNTSCVLSS